MKPDEVERLHQRRAYLKSLFDAGVAITPAVKREIAERFRCSATGIYADLQLLQDPISRRGAREASAVSTQNLRARRLRIEGEFTVKEWRSLCAQNGYRCVRCGGQTPLGPDHIIPLSKGGTNWITNIQPMCFRCNLKKSDKETTDKTGERDGADEG